SVAFVTSNVEGGRPVTSIWSVSLETQQVTRLTQAAAPAEEPEGPPVPRGGFGGGGISSLQFTEDGRTLYYPHGNRLYALNVGGGQGAGAGTGSTTAPSTDGPRRGGAGAAAAAPTGAGGRRVNFTVRVDVDYRKQRQQVFNEAWRVMKHRFYDPDMHG